MLGEDLRTDSVNKYFNAFKREINKNRVDKRIKNKTNNIII